MEGCHAATVPLAGRARFPVLTPNLRGYEAARDAGAGEVAVFAAASEAFSQKNINCSIDESFARFAPVLEAAAQDGIAVRGYLSCVLGCPYSGEVAAQRVSELAARLIQAGCYEVSLGDTIGVGTPHQTQALIQSVSRRVPVGMIAGHFHDTYGQALANVYAAMQAGVRVFDASVSGLGGCPYARGASGNLATEDLVYLCHGQGLDTGVDLDALVDRKLRTVPADTPEQRRKAVNRLVGMLARKGYGGGVAYRVVREALAAHGADAEELGDDHVPD